MNKKTFWLIFALGIALRIFWINVPALWYDENFTLLVAKLPIDRAMDAIKGDVHPPLWYLLEWAIFHIAPNLPPWAIRLPALVFSIGSLWLYTVVMRKLNIPAGVQTAAFVMMALLPFQLWYAQEGRMYAMLEFFVLLTFSAALGQSDLFLFLGSLALLYTQNYGPFYIAAISLVILIREKRANVIASAQMIAAAVICWLPWVMVVFGQMNEIEGRYWIIDKSFGGVLIIIYKLFLTATVPSAFFFASYIVTFAAWILGTWYFVRSQHPARWTITIMALVPLLIAWTASALWQPVLLFRPLIGIAPFLYIITAWSFDDTQLANRPDRLQTLYTSSTR